MRKTLTLVFLFLLLKLAHADILVPNYLVKNQEVEFWFDAYNLIYTKTNFAQNSTLLKSLTKECFVNDSSKASLEAVKNTYTMIKYKLKALDYGYVKLICKATATNENNQIFTAQENRTIFIGDDPNKICNKSDVAISIPDVTVDYLYDLVKGSFTILQTHNRVQIGQPLEVTVDYSNVLGTIKNSRIYCRPVSDYNVSVLLSQAFANDNSFTAYLNLYLNTPVKNYSGPIFLNCTYKAYCDFYGNSELSKNISKDFSIIVNVRPLNDSIFFIINSKALNDSNTIIKQLLNLTREYQIRAALQMFESQISPFFAGIPGLIIDGILSPGLDF